MQDQKLRSVAEELEDLNKSNLKDRGRAFLEAFISKIGLILRGTTAAPPTRFGETLAEEHVRGGTFAAASSPAQQQALAMQNAGMRLYGGAQYNRAMAEFRCAPRPNLKTATPPQHSLTRRHAAPGAGL